MKTAVVINSIYRVRHKSINTPLSHERLVGGLQDGGRGTHVTHFVQLYPQPLYTASQVRTTCRSWDEGVLTDVCLTGVLTDLCLILYYVVNTRRNLTANLKILERFLYGNHEFHIQGEQQSKGRPRIVYLCEHFLTFYITYAKLTKYSVQYRPQQAHKNRHNFTHVYAP